MDSVFENNVLLTQTERLMMSGRPKEPKYARNKNILVNMIDEKLNNGVGKFNREEEKKEQQEKSEARSSFLKERLAAKQKEATQENNKDTKELEKSKNSHREM